MIWKHQYLLGLTIEREIVLSHPSVQGLRLRCYPNGRKTWLWLRQFRGKQLRQTLGRFPAKSMADAQRWAGDLNAAIDQGCDPTNVDIAVVPECSGRVTVEEAWLLYIDDCVRRGNKAVGARDKEGRLDIVATIGHKFVRDVTPQDIRQVVEGPLRRAKVKRKSGAPATTGGAVTSNRILSCVTTLFRFCCEADIDGIEKNPARGVKRIPAKNIHGRKAKRVLSFREMALMILAAREYDRRSTKETTIADAFTLLALFGNRKSEVFNAMGDEWAHDQQAWIVPGERYKTGVDHLLACGPIAASIFERRAKRGKFLIPAQSGIRTGQDAHICARLREIMEEIIGEPVERWTPHCVRYGFRSNIRRLKIADSELAERLIHPKSVRDIAELYEGDRADEMREALLAWEVALMAEVSSIAARRVSLAA